MNGGLERGKTSWRRVSSMWGEGAGGGKIHRGTRVASFHPHIYARGVPSILRGIPTTRVPLSGRTG